MLLTRILSIEARSHSCLTPCAMHYHKAVTGPEMGGRVTLSALLPVASEFGPGCRVKVGRRLDALGIEPERVINAARWNSTLNSLSATRRYASGSTDEMRVEWADVQK
jgi:hypothetical protein